MAVRWTADGLVPVGAAVRRRGLDVESRRWVNTATGHHGRICEYTLLSLMLASERVKRNKQSQFRRLNAATRLPVTVVWIRPLIARSDAIVLVFWTCVWRG